MEISVIGLGYIGLPTSIVLAKVGHMVYGFDYNKKTVETLNNGKIHIKEHNLQEAYEAVHLSGRFRAYDELHKADVYIIAVPTPFKIDGFRKKADLSYIDNATTSVAKVLKEGDLVILESTSPPKSTSRMTDKLCELTGLNRKSFFTAHCPERVLPGKILYELENNDRIIGAKDEVSALKAKELYNTFMCSGNIYTTDDITAEMAKLVENSYRDVNIAFANELSIMCDAFGINVKELISLANKHPRVNILSPSVGVGGHCISVDPWFIVEAFEDAKIIKTAREINDYKPLWISSKIEEALDFNKAKTVGILGLTYKPNIDDLRESPSLVLACDLQKKGYKVIACEPNTDEKLICKIPVCDLKYVMENADVIIIAQKHKEFDNVEASEYSEKLLWF